jgi:hypothetical protein
VTLGRQLRRSEPPLLVPAGARRMPAGSVYWFLARERAPAVSGLADPGGTGEHHTAGAGVPEDGTQRLKLGPTPDQRPRDVHPVILYRPDQPIE